MWIFTTDGFLSIVSKDCREDQLMVRARVRADLKRAFPKAKILTNRGTDYRYRIVVRRKDVANYLCEMAYQLDYDNFKNTVPAKDNKRFLAYHDVWSVMACRL